jgi:hypothetical protein
VVEQNAGRWNQIQSNAPRQMDCKRLMNLEEAGTEGTRDKGNEKNREQANQKTGTLMAALLASKRSIQPLSASSRL